MNVFRMLTALSGLLYLGVDKPAYIGAAADIDSTKLFHFFQTILPAGLLSLVGAFRLLDAMSLGPAANEFSMVPVIQIILLLQLVGYGIAMFIFILDQQSK
jgi:hypothetical protein